MDIRTCKYCNQSFEEVSGRWFSNHVRWCEKNPSSSNTKNIAKANKKQFDDKLGAIESFEVKCFRCQNKFKVEERSKLHPQKEQYFCGRSCANKRKQSSETKIKISKTLAFPKQKRLCLGCNKEFEVIITSTKKHCSVKCGAQSRRSSNEKNSYRHACRFEFNLWDYPDEFDLNLVAKYGWYKAKNRGDNQKGITRDHKISVSFGWENNISPEIIKHPSNCKLMQHFDNVKKNKKCSLILEQLKDDIEKWDKKY